MSRSTSKSPDKRSRIGAAPMAVVVASFAAILFGGVRTYNVASDPDHKQDVSDLTWFVSPAGNDARCASQESQDFAQGLHGIELSEPEAEAFAKVLGDKGMEINGEPVTAEDLIKLNKNDLSNNPGYDCDQPGGASTHIVVQSVKANLPYAVGGLMGIAGVAGYAIGSRRSEEDESAPSNS